MGWHASGDERVRRFRLYQELERKYAELMRDVDQLKGQLAEKDGAIRALAGQLAALIPEPEVIPAPVTEDALEELPEPRDDPPEPASGHPRVIRRKSGTVAKVTAPAKQTLEQVFANHQKAVQGKRRK